MVKLRSALQYTTDEGKFFEEANFIIMNYHCGYLDNYGLWNLNNKHDRIWWCDHLDIVIQGLNKKAY